MIRVVLASVVLVAILFAIYIALDWFMRWSRRRSLEQEHAANGSISLTREDYVDKGLAEYERSTEKRLLLGVFFLPLLVIGLLAFFIN